MNRVLFWLIVSAFMSLTLTTSATVINVPLDYQTIQHGINASVDGDTVLVQPGIYMENINFRGHNIVLGSLFLTTGYQPYIAQTIIYGGQPNHPDTASCVLIVSGEDSRAVLTGFTLTGGSGTVWQNTHNNLFFREGGGILIQMSSPTIKNNIIVNNEAVDNSDVYSAGGGGIRVGDSNSLIENNIIFNNSGRYGSGIVLNYATGTLRGNLILENSGGEDYGGAGIWTCGGGQSIIEGNTIVGNSSAMGGGGLLIWSTSVSAVNNIIYGNTARSGYPQIRFTNGGTGTFRYCDIEGGWSGEGNIDCDPSFCDPDGDFFYLADNSCCVGSGEYGQDMGAFGIGCEPTGIMDEAPLPEISILRNYPNPFNASTTICYSLPEQADVKIEIFDILGQKVRTLFEGNEGAGYHSIIWNAEDCPSGFYFAKLQTNSKSENIKMVLLK